jgi:hypothetical protein
MNTRLWNEHDLKFKHPFTCIISGPTGSGKSNFCIRFLQNLDSLCTENRFAGGILWCYGETSAVPYRELAPLGTKVSYHEGVPKVFGRGALPSLVILDDLLTEAYSREVCDLFTKGSHHRNVSVILITQNLFHQGKHCRDISLNAKYLVLLKNIRDRQQFFHLARQVYPDHPDSLYKAYVNATDRPYGYFILDFAQDTDNRLRFRTNVFPTERLTVYAPVDDETTTSELSRSTIPQDS